MQNKPPYLSKIDDLRELGKLVRGTRRLQGLSQQELAAASGTGVRFIRDMEAGKETCHIGKALHVLNMLGIHLFTHVSNP